VTLAVANLTIGAAARRFHFRAKSSDEGVMKQIFVDKDYDLRRLRRFASLVDYVQRQEKSGRRPLIVDAGANVGASPIFFLSDFATARIVAIEPDRANFDLLTRNTEGLDVECIHGAVRSTPGRARLVNVGEGNWGFRTEAVANGSEDAGKDGADSVACVTINDIYAAHGADCFPFIAKIDIEGGELDLFAANTEWVAQTPLLIIELHDWLMPEQGTSASFLKCIAGLDRDFVYLRENVFSIANRLDALG
jgi:FkbM family methyltransferase